MLPSSAVKCLRRQNYPQCVHRTVINTDGKQLSFPKLYGKSNIESVGTSKSEIVHMLYMFKEEGRVRIAKLRLVLFLSLFSFMMTLLLL